jgi:hypothetical protein
MASAATQDSGTIKTFYATSGGMFAIQLSNGFSNAFAAYPPNASGCGAVTANGYAGLTTADPILKSALLSAKAAQEPVRISIDGCDSNNPTWFKIIGVYIDS